MGAERILIVGGGVAGLAAAHGLARAGAGARVTLLEREDGFAQHASGQNAAILRTAIDAPATRHLALESARLLRAWTSRVPLLDEVGLLVASPDGQPAWLGDHEAAGEALAVGAEQARRLAPHWRPSEGAHLWHLPRQGRLDVAALTADLAARARAGGVTLRTGARVRALDGGGATLEGGEHLGADLVVVAAGAWTDALLGAPALRVTRRHLLVTEADPQVDPTWPVVWDDVAGMYARPESGGLLVSACDLTDVAPEPLVPDPGVKLEVARKVARHLPDFADAGAAHFWPGLRTLTPDDTPLVGHDPRNPGLFWLAGLGGHGMSLSLGVGALAADLLLERDVDPELRAAVAPDRHAAGAHA